MISSSFNKARLLLSGRGPFSNISIHSSRDRMGSILLLEEEDSSTEEEEDEEDNDDRMLGLTSFNKARLSLSGLDSSREEEDNRVLGLASFKIAGLSLSGLGPFSEISTHSSTDRMGATLLLEEIDGEEDSSREEGDKVAVVPPNPTPKLSASLPPTTPDAIPFNRYPFKLMLIANIITIHLLRIGSPTRRVQDDMKDSRCSEVDLEEWKVDGRMTEKMDDVGRL